MLLTAPHARPKLKAYFWRQHHASPGITPSVRTGFPSITVHHTDSTSNTPVETLPCPVPVGSALNEGGTTKPDATFCKGSLLSPPSIVESYEEGKKILLFLYFFDFFWFFWFKFDWILELNQLKSKRKKGILDLVFDFFSIFFVFFSQACRFANAHEKIQLKSNWNPKKSNWNPIEIEKNPKKSKKSNFKKKTIEIQLKSKRIQKKSNKSKK